MQEVSAFGIIGALRIMLNAEAPLLIIVPDPWNVRGAPPPLARIDDARAQIATLLFKTSTDSGWSARHRLP